MDFFHLTFSITQECPFNCDICLRYYDPDSRRMTPGQWEEMVRILKPLGLKRLTVTGGEPTVLGGRLFRFLSFLHSEQIHASLSTSGFRLDEARTREMDGYLDHILMSLPGLTLSDYLDGYGHGPHTQELHETAMNLLTWVRHSGIILEVNTVVHRENQNEILDLGRQLLDMNPDIVWRVNAFYAVGMACHSRPRYELDDHDFQDLCQSVRDTFEGKFRGIRIIDRILQATAPGYLVAQDGNLLLTSEHKHQVTGYNVLGKLPASFPMPRSWDDYRLISRDWGWQDFSADLLA